MATLGSQAPGLGPTAAAQQQDSLSSESATGQQSSCGVVPDRPRVSVVIPAYNAAQHLDAAVGSALAQTENRLEVLVVDDASTDATRELAVRLASGDARVRLLCNDVNRGVAASRNCALAEARGDWIALLDADDTWLPQRLEQLLMAGAGADVVADDVFIVREDGDGPGGGSEAVSFLSWANFDIRTPHRLTAAEFVRHDLGFLKPLFRRSFLSEKSLQYDETLRVAEDFYFYVHVLLAGATWVQVREAYYSYRRRAGSLSRDSENIFRQHAASSAALLDSPAVREDEALLVAVSRFHNGVHERRAKHIVLQLIRQRRFGELARVLRARPGDGLLTLMVISQNLRLRMRRRLRHPFHPVKARILE